MSPSIGYDRLHHRDIGYGVPAVCDQPRCHSQIDRGLAYTCGNEAEGGELGCGLYFCPRHMYAHPTDSPDRHFYQLCDRCLFNATLPDDWVAYSHRYRQPYHPKPDTRTWLKFKLTHPSWGLWRDDHPDDVRVILERLGKLKEDSIL